jgi:phage-related protein
MSTEGFINCLKPIYNLIFYKLPPKITSILGGITVLRDEVFSIITMPSSAIISSVFVAVNNVYHIGKNTLNVITLNAAEHIPHKCILL